MTYAHVSIHLTNTFTIETDLTGLSDNLRDSTTNEINDAVNNGDIALIESGSFSILPSGTFFFKRRNFTLNSDPYEPETDECATFTHQCTTDAQCIDNEASYSCICPEDGMTGGIDGQICTCMLLLLIFINNFLLLSFS